MAYYAWTVATGVEMLTSPMTPGQFPGRDWQTKVNHGVMCVPLDNLVEPARHHGHLHRGTLYHANVVPNL